MAPWIPVASIIPTPTSRFAGRLISAPSRRFLEFLVQSLSARLGSRRRVGGNPSELLVELRIDPKRLEHFRRFPGPQRAEITDKPGVVAALQDRDDPWSFHPG